MSASDENDAFVAQLGLTEAPCTARQPNVDRTPLMWVADWESDGGWFSAPTPFHRPVNFREWYAAWLLAQPGAQAS